MKKRNIFILSAATFLALCSCGNPNPAPASSSQEPTKSSSAAGTTSQTPEPSVSSEPAPSSEPASQPSSAPSSVAPSSEATSLPEEAVTIAFNEATDLDMVMPKVKTYLDAMHEQEKTLEYPYRLTPLYGPEDFGAGKPDRDDNYKGYTADELGGVDVCDYLNRNDYGNKTENLPVTVSWAKGNLEYTSAKVEFWSKEDKSDLRTVAAEADLVSAKLPNCFRATDYKYRVIADGAKRYISQEGTFKTNDYVRTISMGGIGNVRDMGGYMTSYGKRTKQGLIYRGYEIIDQGFSSHGANYNENVEKVNQEVMKIGVEIDLKDTSGRNGRTVSCLQGADYQPLEVVAYDSFITSATSLASIPQIFKLLANADQSHVYFHCWGGADRTGMVAFFLNAILGVSYTDLIADFEITTETNNKRCHMHNSSNAHFPNFLGAFTKLSDYDPNKTINWNCEHWLTEHGGVAAADIAKIRSIMIEDYDETLHEVEPAYTFDTSKWVSDDLGHYHAQTDNGPVKGDWKRHTLVLDKEHSTESDCQHEGEEHYVCSVCGNEVVKHLPKGEHNYKEITSKLNGDGKSVTLGECGGCHEKEISINYLDGTTYSNGTAQSSVSTKMSNDGTTYTEWKINVDKAIPGAKIYFEGKTDSSGNMGRYFFNQNKEVNPVNPITGEEYPDDPAQDQYKDKATEDPWRYTVSVNGGEKINPKVGVTFTEAGCGAGPFYLTDIDLAAGENLVRLHAMKVGYRLTFSGKVHIRYNGDATIQGSSIDSAAISFASGDPIALSLNPSPLAPVTKEWMGSKISLDPAKPFSIKIADNDVDYELKYNAVKADALALVDNSEGLIAVKEAAKYNIYVNVTDIASANLADRIWIEKVEAPQGVLSYVWSDIVAAGSTALASGGKVDYNSTFTLNVDDVPADGKYILSLTMKGSNSNGTRTFNTSGTDHDGQDFYIKANGVDGTFLGAEKTYNEFFGADQNAWVEVAFGEVQLKAGANTIVITTGGGGYRVFIKADGNVTLVQD